MSEILKCSTFSTAEAPSGVRTSKNPAWKSLCVKLEGEKGNPNQARALGEQSDTRLAEGFLCLKALLLIFNPVKSSGVKGDVNTQLFRLC